MDALRLYLVSGLLWLLLAGSAHAACSEIVLGSAVSLTGRYAVEGAKTREGYEFAVAEINRAGGVRIKDKCHTLRVIYYDDESVPERGAELARRLITDNNVRMLLGPYSADVADAVATVAEIHEALLVTAEPVPIGLHRNGYGYIFGLQPAAAESLELALESAAEVARNVGWRPARVNVAMVLSDDQANAEVRARLRERASRLGLKIILDETWPAVKQQRPALFTRIRQERPDLLLVSAHADGAAAAMAAIAEQNLQLPMIALAQCEAADIAKRVPAAAENVLCASLHGAEPLRPTASERAPPVQGLATQVSAVQAVNRFEAAYRAKVKLDGPIASEIASAAAAVYVVADAIGRAGSLQAEAVRAAMVETDLATPIGRVRFAPGGERITETPGVLRQIQGGRLIVVAPAKLATRKLQWPREGL